MTKILFVCHGNICRSPMAEFIMKDLAKKQGLTNRLHVESAACHTDAIGCRPHRKVRELLALHGISTEGKIARLIRKDDYGAFDYIIAMDDYNVVDLKRTFGGDKEGKIKKLLEFAGLDRDVADPWYTLDFDKTYSDCVLGCQAILSTFLVRND